MTRSFETTSWSTILAAKDKEGATSRKALNLLCGTYWLPLYSYIRRNGHSEEESRDLTQEFFCCLLERDFLKNVDHGRGRFRSFLLASANNFLRDVQRKSHAQKRGGSTPVLSLDFALAEGRYALADHNNMDPRILFDRQWAQTVLETVLGRLEEEVSASGKSHMFEVLKECLVAGKSDAPYHVLGKRLGMSEGAVKVTVHRMRRRYATLLREEIARTVEDPVNIEEELRYLIEVAGS